MSNKYGIPDADEAMIRQRDKLCVYCGKAMIFPFDRTRQIDSATIEHLSHLRPFYFHEGMTSDNIVICCGECNSRRGALPLLDWFNTQYCRDNGISADTVAEPVKNYLTKLLNPQ